MSDTSLVYMPAYELSRLIRQKQLSPVELIDFTLQRLEKLNPKLNAFLTVTAEVARGAAHKAEAELATKKKLSPLFGLPISIKDLNFTKGIRTTGGSLAYQNFVPEENGTVVEKLLQAGAILVGKTNTSEFGQSATTENRLGDDCRSPWNLERTSGGSSGGAASATAAGILPWGQGSDGGGSIRIPSSFCGVYGLKPTYGRVSRYGGFGGMPLFSHVGPIARTVRDAALLLRVMAGYDPRDPTTLREPPPDFVGALRRKLRRLRMVYTPNLGLSPADPEVRAVTKKAAEIFASLGHQVEEATPSLENPYVIYAPLVLADEYAASGHLLQDHAEDLMSYVRSTLEHGKRVTGYEYSQALRGLERFRQQMRDFFEPYDLLLMPTTAVPAFPVRQRPKEIDGQKVSTLWGAFPFAMPFNLTGQPAASVPCGFSADGLPIGLQIVGHLGDEVTVLQASAAFEEARPWAGKRPPID